jgi:hypothetical protein
MNVLLLLALTLLLISCGNPSSAGSDKPASASGSTDSSLKCAQDSDAIYSRSDWRHWVDADSDGEDTREEVLAEERLADGRWYSIYDGTYFTNSSDLDIDHFIPLAEAHRSSGANWNAAEKEAFANDLSDPNSLVAVSASSNRSKSDRDPSDWLPSSMSSLEYADTWVRLKIKWGLTVDSDELTALRGILGDDERLPAECSNSASDSGSGGGNSDSSGTSSIVKKSGSGICHDENSPWYSQTTNFTQYDTMQACLDSGGRAYSGYSG